MEESYNELQSRLGELRFRAGAEFKKTVYSEGKKGVSYMLQRLPDNYSEANVTLLAHLFRTFSEEKYKAIMSMKEIADDQFFDKTRPEFLFQILGDLLFIDEKVCGSSYNDKSYRDFLLKVKNAYFGGSVLANLNSSLSDIIGTKVNIKELFKESRVAGSSTTIKDTHKLVMDILVGAADQSSPAGQIGIFIQDLYYFIDLIRPSHTLFETRFIWEDILSIRGCPSDKITQDSNGNTYTYKTNPLVNGEIYGVYKVAKGTKDQLVELTTFTSTVTSIQREGIYPDGSWVVKGLVFEGGLVVLTSMMTEVKDSSGNLITNFKNISIGDSITVNTWVHDKILSIEDIVISRDDGSSYVYGVVYHLVNGSHIVTGPLTLFYSFDSSDNGIYRTERDDLKVGDEISFYGLKATGSFVFPVKTTYIGSSFVTETIPKEIDESWYIQFDLTFIGSSKFIDHALIERNDTETDKRLYAIDKGYVKRIVKTHRNESGSLDIQSIVLRGKESLFKNSGTFRKVTKDGIEVPVSIIRKVTKSDGTIIEGSFEEMKSFYNTITPDESYIDTFNELGVVSNRETTDIYTGKIVTINDDEGITTRYTEPSGSGDYLIFESWVDGKKQEKACDENLMMDISGVSLVTFYEDLRKSCKDPIPELYYDEIVGPFSDPTKIQVSKYPILSEFGELATKNDVKIYVNNVLYEQEEDPSDIALVDPSTYSIGNGIAEVDAIHGVVTLSFVPEDTDLISVYYYYANRIALLYEDESSTEGEGLNLSGFIWPFSVNDESLRGNDWSFQSQKFPILKSNGDLATSDDVIVLINGEIITDAIVSESDVTTFGDTNYFRPILGHIQLRSDIDLTEATVTFKYYYQENDRPYPMILDSLQHLSDIYYTDEYGYTLLSDPQLVGIYGQDPTEIDPETGYPYVYNKSDFEVSMYEETFPAVYGYKYRVFDVGGSSVISATNSELNSRTSLNNKSTLIFSGEYHKDKGAVILNDAYLTKDLDPLLKLHKGVPPFYWTFSSSAKSFSQYPGISSGLVNYAPIEKWTQNRLIKIYSGVKENISLLKGSDDVLLTPICDEEGFAFEFSYVDEYYPNRELRLNDYHDYLRRICGINGSYPADLEGVLYIPDTSSNMVSIEKGASLIKEGSLLKIRVNPAIEWEDISEEYTFINAINDDYMILDRPVLNTVEGETYEFKLYNVHVNKQDVVLNGVTRNRKLIWVDSEGVSRTDPYLSKARNEEIGTDGPMIPYWVTDLAFPDPDPDAYPRNLNNIDIGLNNENHIVRVENGEDPSSFMKIIPETIPPIRTSENHLLMQDEIFDNSGVTDLINDTINKLNICRLFNISGVNSSSTEEELNEAIGNHTEARNYLSEILSFGGDEARKLVLFRNWDQVLFTILPNVFKDTLPESLDDESDGTIMYYRHPGDSEVIEYSFTGMLICLRKTIAESVNATDYPNSLMQIRNSGDTIGIEATGLKLRLVETEFREYYQNGEVNLTIISELVSTWLEDTFSS